jgi:hypothetical protein
MKSNALLKMATVTSSVLLLSVFVSYRVGAFNRLLETRAPPADSGSGPSNEEKLTDGAPQPDPTIMSSSKSMVIHVPPSPNTADAQRARTMMYSSKSGVIATPVPVTAGSQTAQPPAPSEPPPSKTTERARPLMSGSKSGVISNPIQP